MKRKHSPMTNRAVGKEVTRVSARSYLSPHIYPYIPKTNLSVFDMLKIYRGDLVHKMITQDAIFILLPVVTIYVRILFLFPFFFFSLLLSRLHSGH
jgi:hypothetical protein